MTREIRITPQQRLAAAALIDLIQGYASGGRPKTKLESAVEKALQKVDSSRTISKRLIANFNAIPNRFKIKIFGEFLYGRLRAYPEKSLRDVFFHATTPIVLSYDDVGDAPPPEFPMGTEFTISFTGLYCKDQTGDRQIFGSSDEPYVITAAVHVESGENIVKTEIHPVGDPDKRYGDVDNGDSRVGPVAACWAGNQTEVSIVTVVMERDEGDPDAYRDEVEVAVHALAAAAAFFNIPIAIALEAFAIDLFVWILGSEDDEIGTEISVIPAALLKFYAWQPPFSLTESRTVLKPLGPFMHVEEVVIDKTGLEYNFYTRHTNKGEYVITYKVTADQSAGNPPSLSGLTISAKRTALRNT